MKSVEARARISSDEIGIRYDFIADSYEKERSLTLGVNYVQMFIRLLPSKLNPNLNAILDIGCGTGVPLTRFLVSSGVKVLGLDISSKMIEKAKINVPQASFLVGDIINAKLENKFDGILAWDSLFHLPIEKQEKVIRKVIELLNPNGVFLFTAGGRYSELVSTMFGHDFYYSSLSSKQYEKIMNTENCQVIINEIDDPRSYGHRVICCRKRES
jgi:SAM-dependent methyltransferase